MNPDQVTLLVLDVAASVAFHRGRFVQIVEPSAVTDGCAMIGIRA